MPPPGILRELVSIVIDGVSIKTKKELIKLFKDKGYIWNKYEKLFLNNELERYIQIDKVKYEDF